MRANPWKLSTFLLAGALAVSLTLPLVGRADANGKRQPHMQAALSATKAAKRQLKKAAPGKGGHRAKAIVLLGEAEAEIQAGISFADK